MKRTQIYIDAHQQKLLSSIAMESSKSVSALIREAVWKLISEYKKPKKDALSDIVGLYEDGDTQGSLRHDDIYE